MANKPYPFTVCKECAGGSGGGENGLSAYEIAVKNGFKGTEEEWLESLHGADGQPAYYPVIETTESTIQMQPNVYYKCGEVATLDITLGAEIEGVVNEFCGEFVSGETPTVLTFPNNIVWAADYSIEANKTYQFSIVNGIGVLISA